MSHCTQENPVRVFSYIFNIFVDDTKLLVEQREIIYDTLGLNDTGRIISNKATVRSNILSSISADRSCIQSLVDLTPKYLSIRNGVEDPNVTGQQVRDLMKVKLFSLTNFFSLSL